MNIDYYMAQYIPIYRMSYLIVFFVFLLGIILLLKHRNVYINIFEELDKRTKKIMITNMILGFNVYNAGKKELLEQLKQSDKQSIIFI